MDTGIHDTNYASTAAFEEVLMCTDRSAAFANLKQNVPTIGDYQQAHSVSVRAAGRRRMPKMARDANDQAKRSESGGRIDEPSSSRGVTARAMGRARPRSWMSATREAAEQVRATTRTGALNTAQGAPRANRAAAAAGSGTCPGRLRARAARPGRRLPAAAPPRAATRRWPQTAASIRLPARAMVGRRRAPFPRSSVTPERPGLTRPRSSRVLDRTAMGPCTTRPRSDPTGSRPRSSCGTPAPEFRERCMRPS